MNFSEKMRDLKTFIADRDAVYDTLTPAYRAAKAHLILMENPAPNWRAAQNAALRPYIRARATGASREYIADCRAVGLYEMRFLRELYKALGVFPVKHLCPTCRKVSTAPFLIGAFTVAPSCRCDDCPSMWWNKPAFSGDAFEAAKIIVKVDQASKGE